MELNLEEFEDKIVKKMFNNNQCKCANALGITPAFLNKILKRKSSAGAKFFGKLKKFCDSRNLKFDTFIFLR